MVRMGELMLKSFSIFSLSFLYLGFLFAQDTTVVEVQESIQDSTSVLLIEQEQVNYPGKPLIMSLILPGAGQYYNKSPMWKTASFLGVELGSIIAWNYFFKESQRLKEDYKAFADLHWTLDDWVTNRFEPPTQMHESMSWTNFSVLFYSIIASIVAIIFIFKYARKQQETTGKQIPKFFISLGIFTIVPLLTFLIGGVSLSFEYPVLTQLSKTIFNYIGGVAIIPELMALAAALSLYTATFIAECVRAGIMGVTKGQKEAAASIGLTPGQILRLVIMPQALRIIIPPTTNQYLNLTKNSSLAAAIAYPDLVLVFAGTAMMQTGRAIEIVSITMLTYLSISIVISILMNWYNKKMAIKEK